MNYALAKGKTTGNSLEVEICLADLRWWFDSDPPSFDACASRVYGGQRGKCQQKCQQERRHTEKPALSRHNHSGHSNGSDRGCFRLIANCYELEADMEIVSKERNFLRSPQHYRRARKPK